MHRLTVDLPIDLFERINAIKGKEERPLAGIVRIALREYLDKHAPPSE